ncbi:MAG: Gfo/Idh/MocA family oxidoreductase [bacterium]
MAKLKAAVIGCGAIAQHCHIPGYLGNKGCELVAAADPSGARRKEAKEKFGVPRTYTSAETLFKRETPDVVSICTPNRFHAEQAVMALEHGCHVLCEKPLCLSMAEAQRIKRAKEKSGAVLMTAFTHRLFRGNQKAKQIIEKGDIGDPFMIRVRFAHGGPQPGWAMSDWFYNPELSGGGAMLDMGIHAIDLATYLLGPITAVSARVATLAKPIKVDDNAVMILEFGRKCLGYIEVGWTSKPGYTGAEIYGSEGSMFVDYSKGFSVLRGRTMPDGTVKSSWRTIDKKPATGGWAIEVDYFLRHVRKGIQPDASLEAGMDALAVALAAYKSAKTGKRVKI